MSDKKAVGSTELNPRGTVRAGFEAGDEDAGDLDAVAPTLVAFGELHRLGEAEVWSAIELARLASGLEPRGRVALAVLVCVTQANRQEGSTLLPLAAGEAGPIDGWLASLAGDLEEAGRVGELAETGELRERIDGLLQERRAPEVVGEPGAYRPLIWDGEVLYHQQMLDRERTLVDLVGPRLEGGAEHGMEVGAEELAEAMASLDAHMPVIDPDSGARMELNARQREAVECAARHPLTLVSGGPGTGKTAVVVSMLRVMARLGVEPERIAVAAPTGKAANRLGEELRGQLAALEEGEAVDRRLRERLREPETLHRLLGYSPRRDAFRFDERNPLSVDLVVVDEASMVDVFLMRQLVGAVPPEAHLVLVGDADQLPSVRNGAVFRDLVPGTGDEEKESAPAGAGDEAAVRLEHSYRMREETSGGAAILRTARAVNRGATAELLEGDDVRRLDASGDGADMAGQLDWEGVAAVESQEGIEAVLDAWFDRFGDMTEAARPFRQEDSPAEEGGDHGLIAEDRRRLEAVFARQNRARLLALTRVYATGTERINARFHARSLRRHRGQRAYRYLAGEPVMMLRNDYQLGLYNGDQGIVVLLERDGRVRPAVAFRTREGFRTVGLARLREDIEHAYAMTVHKAQGSEFEHVALLLPPRSVSLLTRELVYTGLTRASRSVTLLGSLELFELAARRPMQRHTGVPRLLRAR